MELATLSNNRMQLHFHAGQQSAWDSLARFVAVVAGTQGGKTSFLPHWLYREIQKRGPGDYLFVTPTFPLLELKALPEFLNVFSRWLQLGRYVASPRRVFRFSDAGAQRTFGKRFDPRTSPETRVIFGYATDPESLESATAKAAVLDEAGQNKFRVGSWEAVLRRLSLAQGRVLITTSVYALNWLKSRIYDPFKAGDKDFDVIQFESVMNPNFPQAEFERARKDLPAWKFNMQYRGMFERPAGLIYDGYEDTALATGHLVPRFAIPAHWPRYLGLDFGSANTAAVLLAEEPITKKLFCYRDYHAGGKSALGHVRALLHGERGVPYAVGGSASEDEWRQEFRDAGLGVREPLVKDVQVGIDRVYASFQKRELFIFDDLSALREDLMTYSRELDENGLPTEKIEDKSSYHRLDALRYVVSDLRMPYQSLPVTITQAVDPLELIDQGRKF